MGKTQNDLLWFIFSSINSDGYSHLLLGLQSIISVKTSVTFCLLRLVEKCSMDEREESSIFFQNVPGASKIDQQKDR